MDADDDICFRDLDADTAVAMRAPATMAEFLADGFPPGGDLATLAQLARLPDPGNRFAGMREKLLGFVEMQRRAGTEACARPRSA